MSISVNATWSALAVGGGANASVATSTTSPPAGTNAMFGVIVSSTALSSVTDSRSNTYTVIALAPTPGGAFVNWFETLLLTPLTGSQTVKITGTFASAGNGTILPLSAVISNVAADQIANAAGTSTAPDSGSVSTSFNSLLAIGVTSCDTAGAAVAFTAGSGYTSLTSNTTNNLGKYPGMIEARVVSSLGSGAYDANASLSTSQGWVQVTRTLVDSTSGGGPATVLWAQSCL